MSDTTQTIAEILGDCGCIWISAATYDADGRRSLERPRCDSHGDCFRTMTLRTPKTHLVAVDGVGIVFHADGLDKQSRSSHDLATQYEEQGHGVYVYYRGVCVSETHERPEIIAKRLAAYAA